MTLLVLAGLVTLAAIGVTTKDGDTRMVCAMLAFTLAMLGGM